MTVSLVKDKDWHEIRAYWFGFAVRQGAYSDACAEFAEMLADAGVRVVSDSAARVMVREVNDRIRAERA